MKRFRSVFIAWLLVIAVVTRPTPAEAFVPLVPAIAVGAMIAAAGIMVAGAAVYSKPSFDTLDATVDAVTGDITCKAIVARAIGDGLNNVASKLYGQPGQYTIDFGKLFGQVQADPASYPAIKPATDAAIVPVPITPSVGNVFSLPDNSHRKILTMGTTVSTFSSWLDRDATPDSAWATIMQNCINIGGDRFVTASYTAIYWGHYSTRRADNLGFDLHYNYAPITTTTTTDPVNPVPAWTNNPAGWAAAYPKTEAAKKDLDKAVGAHPDIVKQPPAALTPEQIQTAVKDAIKEASQEAARKAQERADADPTNPDLQTAADQAKAEADKAALEAEQAQGENETKKEDTPPASLAPAPDAPALDFSPLYDLKDAVASHYPFCWLSSLAGYFSPLVSDPVAPHFEFPNGFGGQMVCDLSSLDSVAAPWRAALLFFFNGICIYAIVRRWS